MPKPALRAAERPSSPAGRALAMAVAATAIIYIVPYGRWIGYPLVLLSTIVHEMGHGVAGMLVGGHFESFVVGTDASGLAHITGYSTRFAIAFVSAGGLCGPACAAAVAFVAARTPRMSRVAVLAAGALLTLSLVLVVRNLFGWLAVGGVAAGLLAVGWKARAERAQALLVFLAVQLSLSVFSRSDYLFTDVAHTVGGTVPSDVATMASALFLPYWFWGALCGAFSIAVLALGARAYLGAVAPPVAASPRGS
jgi:hypothetical protein